MKLAEALSIRKDLSRKIEQIKSRLLSNVRLQQDDKPAEEPEELFKELDSCLVQLQSLIARINKTNMNTVSEGRTLTEMMAEKEVLGKRIEILRAVFDKGNETQDRYSRTEIKMVTVIDIKALNKQIEKLSEQLRKLDIKIQGLNFLTDLME
ncbi:DIP1984 family protein [Prevotella sp. HUN102]|uniref:DIP1984 family protein n=1 Tax=Prevotella sp. HUN102 TaxID=1392486 RepID=UPI0004910384|nr:DIP1984 family protein [Prevotella sp. HUN102]